MKIKTEPIALTYKNELFKNESLNSCQRKLITYKMMTSLRNMGSENDQGRLLKYIKITPKTVF